MTYSDVSGGNARDLAREKNLKKQIEQQKRKCSHEKGSNKGMSLEQRKQRYFHFAPQILYIFLPSLIAYIFTEMQT